MTRGAETKQKTARRFVGRVTLVTVFFGIVASSLAARAVYLQVLDKDFLNQQADTRHLRTEKISAHRGTISDRNGEPLAISTPVDSIWANPKQFAPAVDSIPKLARALGIDSQMLMRRVTRSMDKEFLYLKRHLSPEEANEVLDLDLPGINVQREYRRYYPASEVTGHLVGFTNIDDEGQEGLELAFNHWLAGEVSRVRNASSRIASVVRLRTSRAYAHRIMARTCGPASICACSISLIGRSKQRSRPTMRAPVRLSYSTSRLVKCLRWSISQPTTRMTVRNSVPSAIEIVRLQISSSPGQASLSRRRLKAGSTGHPA
jgi:hypothetical protein